MTHTYKLHIHPHQQDILRFTSPQHRDYIPLTHAYVKACEIATLADDDATKLATMCHVLYKSVKSSPVSLYSHVITLSHMTISALW